MSLSLIVVSARNLRSTQTVGTQDPFCKISLLGMERNTRVHTDGGSAGEWNEKFDFADVNDPEAVLAVGVWNKNVMSSKEIGTGYCRVGQFAQLPEVWLPLKKAGRETGQVCVRGQWTGAPSAQAAAGGAAAAAVAAGQAPPPPVPHVPMPTAPAPALPPRDPVPAPAPVPAPVPAPAPAPAAVAANKCATCGASRHSNQQFCTRCGAAFAAPAAAPSAPAAPTAAAGKALLASAMGGGAAVPHVAAVPAPAPAPTPVEQLPMASALPMATALPPAPAPAAPQPVVVPTAAAPGAAALGGFNMPSTQGYVAGPTRPVQPQYAPAGAGARFQQPMTAPGARQAPTSGYPGAAYRQQQQHHAPVAYAQPAQVQHKKVQCGACRTILMAQIGVAMVRCPTCQTVLRVG